MPFQITEIFFGILPPKYYLLIAPIALMVAGFLVEKKFVGRITVFSNSMALVAFFIPLNNVPVLLKLFINFAIILGIIGAWKYYNNESLDSRYYNLAKYVSTIITGIILLIGVLVYL